MKHLQSKWQNPFLKNSEILHVLPCKKGWTGAGAEGVPRGHAPPPPRGQGVARQCVPHLLVKDAPHTLMNISASTCVVPSLPVFLTKSRSNSHFPCQVYICDITKWICTYRPVWNSENHVFNMATLTLTFDLWPWPLNSSEISSRSTPVPNFRSEWQRVWLWECSLTCRQTYGHTHGTDFIPSEGKMLT